MTTPPPEANVKNDLDAWAQSKLSPEQAASARAARDQAFDALVHSDIVADTGAMPGVSPAFATVAPMIARSLAERFA